MGRLANESRALFDDLREWVDLRVQLIQVDVEERIEKVANELMSMMIVMVMALFTLVFLLHGVAVGLGSLLGGTHWGYLIVGALLGFITWMVRKARPNHFKRMASMYRVDPPAEQESPAGALMSPAPSATVSVVESDTVSGGSAADKASDESGGKERG